MARKRWPYLLLAFFIFIIVMDVIQVMVRFAPETLDSEEQAFEAWWQEQLKRRRRVAETCATLGLTTRASRDVFLYDAPHRLLLCYNAKVSEQNKTLNI